MDPFEIIPYQPEFKQQVIELQTLLWSPSIELNRAYFEWKHESNPYVRSPLVYLALERGKVVGMRGFFGVQWQAGSPTQLLTGLHADDLAIAPEHRNRGLIPRIMHFAFDDLARLGYEFLFSLSAGSVTYLSSLATGWHSVARAQTMWRQPDGGPARATEHLRDSPFITQATAPPLDIMCTLAERQGTDGRIRHVRDRAYFAWRVQNPLSRYEYLFCEEKGSYGYLTLQEYTSSRADRTTWRIVDWEAVSVPVLSGLLDAACSVAGSRKLVIWSGTLAREKLNLLRQAGFQNVEDAGVNSRLIPILVRALRQDRPVSDWLLAGRRLTDIADWDVRLLDSMQG